MHAAMPLSVFLGSLDVYVTQSDAIKLLDINAVCLSSSPLLFSWEELGLDPENQNPSQSGRYRSFQSFYQSTFMLCLQSTARLSQCGLFVMMGHS